MSINNIEQNIKHFIKETFLFSGNETFHQDTNLFESNIIDSTGVLDLVSHLEQTYQIVVDDSELLPENFSTLSSIINFIMRKI